MPTPTRRPLTPELEALRTAFSESIARAAAEHEAALEVLRYELATFIAWRSRFVKDLPEEVPGEERDDLRKEINRAYAPVLAARAHCVEVKVPRKDLNAAFKPLGGSRNLGLPGLAGYEPPAPGGMELRGSFAMHKAALVQRAVDEYIDDSDDEGEDGNGDD